MGCGASKPDQARDAQSQNKPAEGGKCSAAHSPQGMMDNTAGQMTSQVVKEAMENEGKTAMNNDGKMMEQDGKMMEQEGKMMQQDGKMMEQDGKAMQEGKMTTAKEGEMAMENNSKGMSPTTAEKSDAKMGAETDGKGMSEAMAEKMSGTKSSQSMVAGKSGTTSPQAAMAGGATASQNMTPKPADAMDSSSAIAGAMKMASMKQQTVSASTPPLGSRSSSGQLGPAADPETFMKSNPDGLYLYYEEQERVLYSRYSKTPIPKALAFSRIGDFTTIPQFKYNRGTVLQSSRETGKKAYFKAWCAWFKEAKSIDGEFVLLPALDEYEASDPTRFAPFNIFFLAGNKVTTATRGLLSRPTRMKFIEAVACLPSTSKEMDSYIRPGALTERQKFFQVAGIPQDNFSMDLSA